MQAGKLRIAIAGTHGAGKTTLARMLARELGLPLIEERARVVSERHHTVNLESLLWNRDGAVAWQREIFWEQYKSELALAKEGFVSDRSLWDNLAYWALYGVDDTEEYRHCLALTRSCASYNHLFVLRPFGPPQADGLRLTCPGCQRFIDKQIEHLLNLYGEPYTDLDRLCGRVGLEVTPENRLAVALETIENARKARVWMGEMKYCSASTPAN